MGCFLLFHHEFSVLTCLSSSSSMVHSSRSTFCLLPYRAHVIAKLWPGSSYSGLVTVNSSRGTCFYCPSLLCFTNLLLWPDLLIHYYYPNSLIPMHIPMILFPLHICSCVNFYCARFSIFFLSQKKKKNLFLFILPASKKEKEHDPLPKKESDLK